MDRQMMFDILNNPRGLSLEEIRPFYDELHKYNQDWCEAYNSLTPDMIDYAEKISEMNKEFDEQNKKLDLINKATPVKSFIKAYKKPFTSARNLMGCNENWYNSYYAIAQTFDDETLEQMSDIELQHLIELGDKISEALY